MSAISMLFKLNDRSVCSVNGPDSATLLNAVLTQKICPDVNGKSVYACLLSPQSKFLLDLMIISQKDGFLLDIGSAFLEMAIKKLNFYKFNYNCDIAHNPELIIYAGDVEKIEGTIYSDPRHTTMPKRKISTESIDTNFGSIEYRDILIENGIPSGEMLLQNKSFILDFAFDKYNSIDFEKGCYIGQEMITRTYRTGEIRKGVYLAKPTTHNPEKTTIFNIAEGENIMLNDERIGFVLAINSSHTAILLQLKHETANNIKYFNHNNSTWKLEPVP